MSHIYIDSHPELKEEQQLLISIKGIGAKSAAVLMAEMYDLARYEIVLRPQTPLSLPATMSLEVRGVVVQRSQK